MRGRGQGSLRGGQMAFRMWGGIQDARQRLDGVRVTPRQAQMLYLAARDLSDKQIADRLGIALSTVRTQLERFYHANGVHSRTGAVAMWLRSRETSV